MRHCFISMNLTLNFKGMFDLQVKMRDKILWIYFMCNFIHKMYLYVILYIEHIYKILPLIFIFKLNTH